MAYCTNAKQRAYVAEINALKLFAEQKYDLAATYFISSGLSFETVCLKYLEANQGLRLIKYLNLVRKKIDPNDPEKRPQRMIICTWIAELMLAKIETMRARNSYSFSPIFSANMSSVAGNDGQDGSPSLDEIEE